LELGGGQEGFAADVRCVSGRGRSPVIPIIGARKMSQFQDNLDCLKWNLSDEHFDRLNEVSAIQPGFPAEFYARDMVRAFSYGGTRELIDA
jgi:hypothetical protein